MVFCGGDGWFWGCDGEEADGFWERERVVLMVEEGDGFGRG